MQKKAFHIYQNIFKNSYYWEDLFNQRDIGVLPFRRFTSKIDATTNNVSAMLGCICREGPPDNAHNA